MIKIAHISDLHFSKLSLGLTQFFSKSWLGNINLFLNRSKQYLRERPFSLVSEFKKKGITHVIISGDLTTTSSHQEYKIAKHFVESLEKEGLQVFVIPGNHDHYTKKSYQTKRFYHHFPPPNQGKFHLNHHGVCSLNLAPKWHLILMDTALPTSLISSNGYFSPNIEKHFKTLIKNIPPEENSILVNHFPFFDHDLPRRRLIRGDRLLQLVKKCPHIQIYLHGHTHRHTIADLRSNHLPLILNSGSTGHRNGSWNQMDLKENSLKITVNRWENGWKETDIQTFSFESTQPISV